MSRTYRRTGKKQHDDAFYISSLVGLSMRCRWAGGAVTATRSVTLHAYIEAEGDELVAQRAIFHSDAQRSAVHPDDAPDGLPTIRLLRRASRSILRRYTVDLLADQCFPILRRTRRPPTTRTYTKKGYWYIKDFNPVDWCPGQYECGTTVGVVV